MYSYSLSSQTGWTKILYHFKNELHLRMLGHTAVYYADLHSLVVFGGFVPHGARYCNFISDNCVVPENIQSHLHTRKVCWLLTSPLPPPPYPMPGSLWKYPVWVHAFLLEFEFPLGLEFSITPPLGKYPWIQYFLKLWICTLDIFWNYTLLKTITLNEDLSA